MEKKVNIVLNDISVTLRPLYEAFTDDPKYPDDLFVTSHEAEELADDNTMVVVVDTNKPKMTECERLLRLTKTIAVLDHHRQSDEVIENAVLSYIEPYASSACEMVAEVLQYIGDDLRLNSMEANSMYAGILVDTNNFMSRTGVRTFEAAAYLRRCGADVTYVRKLLRDDMASYRAKAAVISSAEVYRDVFAIARGEHLGIESPTIIGAQASNELLNIEEIKASFVLTEYNGKIYISARSIDEINVQIIMERLGGGGHINTAGAQFPYSDMERAIETLKKNFDYVILDTAPVGMVTDTLLVGRVVDLSVYVCRADYTRKAEFTLINELANSNKLPNLCTVINGLDLQKKKYGYYYGYGKYGKYYGYGKRYGYGYGYGETHHGGKGERTEE